MIWTSLNRTVLLPLKAQMIYSTVGVGDIPAEDTYTGINFYCNYAKQCYMDGMAIQIKVLVY